MENKLSHLLKLELKKFNLKKQLFITLLLILFSILFLTVSLVDSMTDPEQTKDTFESTFLVIGILMAAIFLVYSSILTASDVIGEYTRKTITILFCCPLNKKKLIAAKLILITAFTAAAMLEGSFHAAYLPGWIMMAAVSTACCALLSLWPFCIGILKKSGSAAIVTSLAALLVRQLMISKTTGNHENLLQLLVLLILTAAALAAVFRRRVTAVE